MTSAPKRATSYLAGDARGQLDVAAGEAEIERPDGILAAPGKHVLEARHHETAPHGSFERPGIGLKQPLGLARFG